MRYHPYSVFQNTQDLRIQAFGHALHSARGFKLRSIRRLADASYDALS